MKKILKTLLITFLFIPMLIYGEEKKLNIYLFYGNKCPHCAELEKYLDKYFNTRHLESDWCWNDINKNNVSKII